MTKPLAHAVIAPPLYIWTMGTGKFMAKKEIANLRGHGLPVGRTCRITKDGQIYKGDQLLDIVIARNDTELHERIDTDRFSYRVIYL